MTTSVRASDIKESEPKLRHEFVGMMFAVAIGEVGIQAATLVQANNWVHFLPAYFHLFLAACLIATSWVGWTLSYSPGARTDVQRVFEWEFLLLLLDVLLVIVYFIIARSVDFTGETTIELKASAAPEAFWIVVVFGLYLVWDFVSKVPLYLNKHRSEPWLTTYGVRIAPTLICLILAYAAKLLVEGADPAHVLTADIALIALVLLFRALKDIVSTLFPNEHEKTATRSKRKWAIGWSILFGLLFVLGILWTRLLPINGYIAAQIEVRSSPGIDHSEGAVPAKAEPPKSTH